MQDSNIQKRLTLAIDLLSELKYICSQLKQSSSDLKKCSGAYFERFFNENKGSMQKQFDKFDNNLSKVKQLNAEITTRINAWFEFTKDSSETKRLLFPVKFYFKRRDLIKSIKKANQTISDTTIENRFIKEQIVDWEHELELQAVQHLKQGNDYKNFELLLQKKEALISELRYLLPSIPAICPVELNLDDLDRLIDKLTELAAA